MRSSFRSFPALFLAFSVMALGQVASISPVRAPLNFAAIPRPPIPVDTQELVTGPAQPVQDAEQRIAAIALLKKARDLSNVRAQPYHLRTSFTATDGGWMLEDISPGRGYRWTAQGPNYSSVNLYPESSQDALYGNQPSGVIPLRLLQVRAAIFFNSAVIGPQASVRTATGYLNGVEQRCVLVAIGAGNRTYTGGRNWEESEHCVDANSGLLTMYSPAPGLFVRYDYSSGLRFHNKAIPTGFTISEAGKTVVEARTVSVTEPADVKDPMFNPAGLTALGVGRAMNPGANLPLVMPAPGRPFPTSAASAEMQVVVLHGNVAGDGRLSEIAILASSDPSLNDAALERAKSLMQSSVQVQPGATAQSREMILTLEFVSQARN